MNRQWMYGDRHTSEYIKGVHIFLEIFLDLAVRHTPSPFSPPLITRADLVAGTTVVSLLFLSSFWYLSDFLTLDRYLSDFLTFDTHNYI